MPVWGFRVNARIARIGHYIGMPHTGFIIWLTKPLLPHRGFHAIITTPFIYKAGWPAAGVRAMSQNTEAFFGYSWEEIQKRQQKQHTPEIISGSLVKPTATEGDKKLLVEKGAKWLKEQQFFGVIDRLQTSGLWESE